mgnify:CR=1 FL=1
MDNKNNMDECMWMIMGSIHESDRITVAKCLDMMEEKGISPDCKTSGETKAFRALR